MEDTGKPKLSQVQPVVGHESSIGLREAFKNAASGSNPGITTEAVYPRVLTNPIDLDLSDRPYLDSVPGAVDHYPSPSYNPYSNPIGRPAAMPQSELGDSSSSVSDDFTQNQDRQVKLPSASPQPSRSFLSRLFCCGNQRS